MAKRWQLIVKVWCLSPTTSQDDLRDIYQNIVSAAVHTDEIPVKDESDMMTFFPADLMEYGAGEEVFCEIRSRNGDIPSTALIHFAQKVIRLLSLRAAAEVVDCDIYDHFGRRVIP